jgi:hypothetical protein
VRYAQQYHVHPSELLPFDDVIPSRAQQNELWLAWTAMLNAADHAAAEQRRKLDV